jgi:hypothetical protein
MKKFLLIPIVATLAACSGMQEVPERKTHAEPSWYQACAQTGTEGYFWFAKEYAYACGSGESLYAQAAEAQADTIALDSFAKRINTRVNSSTEIAFENDKKSTKTKIVSSVEKTAIRDHSESEKYHYTMGGRHYTFIRLKMSKATFEQLKEEAKSAQ